MDIFNKELLLIPIHLEVHWSLISVDVRRRTITYFDSQRTLNRRCPKVQQGRREAGGVGRGRGVPWRGTLGRKGGLVSVSAAPWAHAGDPGHHLFLFAIRTAYCQVSTGRGREERPAGFPPGLERLLQNGEFLEGRVGVVTEGRPEAKVEATPLGASGLKGPPSPSLECGQAE